VLCSYRYRKGSVTCVHPARYSEAIAAMVQGVLATAQAGGSPWCCPCGVGIADMQNARVVWSMNASTEFSKKGLRDQAICSKIEIQTGST
jgi:hypothetical protein